MTAPESTDWSSFPVETLLRLKIATTNKAELARRTYINPLHVFFAA